MSESIFYPVKRKANEHKVTVMQTTSLISKAPTRQKRIKMRFVMNLTKMTKGKLAASPEWILDALEQVQKHGSSVKETEATFTMDLEIWPLNSDQAKLFDDGPEKVQAARCTIKGFQFSNLGDSEDPEVAMTFPVYTAYTENLWRAAGAMGGKEVWVKFTPVIPEEPEEEEDDSQEEFELSGEDEGLDPDSQEEAEEEEFEEQEEE